MGSTKLKEDLTNCLINFDRRVLITELLDNYQLAYEEVNDLVEKYVEQQEKKDKLKFDKRFLVHGVVEGEQKKEIYKIVEETKLKDWLKKLKNAESSLYSVEVAGGAKSAAPVFKPMSVQEGVKLKERHGSKASTSNGTAESSKITKPIEKKEVKQEATSSKALKVSPKSNVKATTKVEASAKKTSPKTETSPTDKKAADKKSANKKGINNFFAPATSANKKIEDTKDSKAASGVVKPPTPKKMEDFFKKQTDKPKTSVESIKKTPAVNTSIQLFDDEEEEEAEEISSDEEEKLEALKRDIISSDVEMEAEDENDTKPTASNKRRRILDSDDEEEVPPVKQEKLDIKKETKDQKEEEEAEEPVAETYLDEDGFVITKKPKQKSTANKSPATKKTPPVTLKTSPKDSKKPNTSKETKAATNPAAKTKQAGIMNFFTSKENAFKMRFEPLGQKMFTRRNWLLRCSILINIAVILYICSHVMIGNRYTFTTGSQLFIQEQQTQSQQAQQGMVRETLGKSEQLTYNGEDKVPAPPEQPAPPHGDSGGGGGGVVAGAAVNNKDAEAPEMDPNIGDPAAVIGNIAPGGNSYLNNTQSETAGSYIVTGDEKDFDERLRSLLKCYDKSYEPETLQRGDFWVLKNYVRAEHGELKCHESITYTTHADYSFLDNLIPLLERWNAPISIAMHAPGTDFQPTLDSIKYLRDCLPESNLVRSYATFHFYFSTKHIPKTIPKPSDALKMGYNCSLPAPYVNVTSGHLYKAQKKLLYPVNVGRNIARDAAITHFILASDIELYPNPGLVKKFLEMIARNEQYLQRKSP
ncbi:hypothetical protein FF38_09204, partial [Lucilia cuprina]